MRLTRTGRAVLLLPALLAGAVIAGDAKAGNIFDAIGAIFGGDPPQPTREFYRPAEPDREPEPYRTYSDREGLDVTVRPRRKRQAAAPRPVERMAAIDPVKVPTWYLEDPTLRRGDIVVLPGQVLVFEGDRGGDRRIEDFASLDESRLISNSERQRLQAMAGLPATAAYASAEPEREVRTSRRGARRMTSSN
jgi:hypothetical protein